MVVDMIRPEVENYKTNKSKIYYNKVFNKVIIRSDIESCKKRCTMDRNKKALVRAAILKGIYIAIGGKKGVVIPPEYNMIAQSSYQVFNVLVNKNTGNRMIDCENNSILTQLLVSDTTNIEPESIARAIHEMVYFKCRTSPYNQWSDDYFNMIKNKIVYDVANTVISEYTSSVLTNL